MSKIAVVTLYHNNINYGGQLQAHAMQRLFSRNGHEAYLLDFALNERGYLLHRLRHMTPSMIFTSFSGRILFKLAKRSKVTGNSIKTKLARFNEWISKTPHTRFYSEASISDCNNDYDIFVTGSDQVWNPNWWNDIYFLTFTNKRKVAFAVSIAIEKLTDMQIGCIMEKTSSFAALSLRESGACQLLEKLTTKKVDFALDPTLMMPLEYWRSLAIPPSIKSNYVLLFSMEISIKAKKAVYDYFHSQGLVVVYIAYANNMFEYGISRYADIVIADAGPREWLGLILKAAYVITNSFHACCFSIIFEKPFGAFGRHKQGKRNTDSRIKSLLCITGLDDRFIVCEDLNAGSVIKSINYSDVKAKIAIHQKNSLEFINSVIC